MMSKVRKGIIGTGAAVLTAAAITLSMQSTVTMQGGYQVERISDYKSILTIDVPEDISADVFEVYFDGGKISRELLSNGKTYSISMLFDDMSQFEVRLFKRRKQIAVGDFKGGILKLKVKKEGLK